MNHAVEVLKTAFNNAEQLRAEHEADAAKNSERALDDGIAAVKQAVRANELRAALETQYQAEAQSAAG